MAILRVVSILGNEAKKGTDQYISNYDIRLEQIISALAIAEGNKIIQIDTGEGKTLITQLAATINALEGKKVNVIPHAKSYVERDCDANMFWLGKIFNLNIAHRYMQGADAKKADIYYIDMPQAVADSLVDQVTSEEDKKNNKLSGRKADVAHVDETDNPTLDMESSTTPQLTATLKEISDDRKEDFKTFLIDLNIYLRETVVNDQEFQEKDKSGQLNAIKEKFKEYKYTESFSDQDWEMWVSAVVTAMQFKDKEDYIVAENNDGTYSIHLMHQKTSGREDKNSQWSNGVHQAVSAWEQSQEEYKDKNIVINEPAKVIAETDITNYMTQYNQVTGITGSVGDKKSIDTMHKVLGTSEVLVNPRAKRLDTRDKTITFDDIIKSNQKWVAEQTAMIKGIKLSNINYNNLKNITTSLEQAQILKEYVTRFGPTTLQHKKDQVKSYDDLVEGEYTFPKKNIRSNGNDKLKPTDIYNRRYDFPAIYTEDSESAPYKEHFTKILETLQGARDRNLSSIVFFNTIAECEAFYEFLKANNIKQDDLLLFDDTVTEEDMKKPNNYKTSESVVLGSCNIPRKITITTAAGGRATDFKGVDVGIVAKPGLLRVLIQLLGRVGRNGAFAITHQIYSKLDIDEKSLIPSKAKKILGIDSNASKAENILGPSDDNILQMQRERQQRDLIDSLNQRRSAPLAIFKLNIQKEFYAALNNSEDILNKQDYLNKFQEFFSNIDSLWEKNKSNPEQRLEDIKNKWKNLALHKVLIINDKVFSYQNNKKNMGKNTINGSV